MWWLISSAPDMRQPHHSLRDREMSPKLFLHVSVKTHPSLTCEAALEIFPAMPGACAPWGVGRGSLSGSGIA